MFNYATKTDLKNAAGVDTSKCVKKTNSASFKFDADEWNNDKLKDLSSNLSNLKIKQIS